MLTSIAIFIILATLVLIEIRISRLEKRVKKLEL
jgi:hypothetical protein